MTMLGEWTVHDSITEQDLQIFNNAVKGLVGVKYEPTMVATQMVNGTNYCFISKSAIVTLNPHEGISKVTIYKPLQGDAVLTGIESIL